MQTLPEKILHEASSYLGCYEDFSRTNRSSCVDYFSTYNGTEPKDEAWCAKFVSTVLKKSLLYFFQILPFSYTASTATMLAAAKKKGVKVDNNPKPGAVFYIPRVGGGHVGFVKEVIYNKNLVPTSFTTIEGNSFDSKVKLDGVVIGQRNLTDQYQFMHYEMLSDLKIPTSNEMWKTVEVFAALYGAYQVIKLFGDDAKKLAKKTLF